MIPVDILITCHDREDYLPWLLKIIHQYTKINPHIIIAYNGTNDSFLCTVRRTNLGLSPGDLDLMQAGLLFCQHNRILKLSIDTWPCDEEIIIDIFNRIEHKRLPYAGNVWDDEGIGLSTDIMFIDLRWGNIFNGWKYDGRNIEHSLQDCINALGIGYHNIPERMPVHPDQRFQCDNLKLCCYHDLETNIACARKWGVL